MSDPTPPAGADLSPAPAPQQASFQIEKLYVKDLSLEVPNAPQIFMQTESPQLEIQVRNEGAQFADGLLEATVTVTVTARAGEKTAFLAEVAQAGLFSVRGIPAQDLEPLLGIACPTILYPYAREAISDLVTRAGFPAVVLAPVSFEQIYLERRQQQAAAEPKIELAN
ncbi:MAG: protein-export chaperone SecB [Betaproteobacteria bacterium]|nr:protein-export chaperone SecB [Betaproteobacteria bacterium]MSQ88856.1 protein-export chaperone SecB [Betaproteobacteria bacterium]